MHWECLSKASMQSSMNDDQKICSQITIIQVVQLKSFLSYIRFLLLIINCTGLLLLNGSNMDLTWISGNFASFLIRQWLRFCFRCICNNIVYFGIFDEGNGNRCLTGILLLIILGRNFNVRISQSNW